MSWPVVALIGFLVLMALVIALGTRSTMLYERGQQGQTSATSPDVRRPTSDESLGPPASGASAAREVRSASSSAGALSPAGPDHAPLVRRNDGLQPLPAPELRQDAGDVGLHR